KYLLFFLIFFGSQQIQSQILKTTNQHAWISYTGVHAIKNKLSLQVELSIRRNEFLKNPQQLLFRTGLVKEVSNGYSVAGGYCYVLTYPYGAFASKSDFPEHRLWEQIQLRKKVKKLELVSRVRLEQRFVYAPILINASYQIGPAVYSTRIRVMHRVSFPLYGTTIKDHAIYSTVFDEVMYGFGLQIGSNHFDQNRAFVGLGYVVPKFGRIEMGYLHQHILKSAGTKIENNKTILINFLPNFSLFKL
ncbi:MAG: DUF2490 domain-containing protein, partial [Chitinophagia bacterium]|nr:DUF2490 domain-containing protein [Chitinophagia bacterium]